MPQETNLNVSPYFDDFDPSDNYYKVLFKPGYPVQARELTTSQTILQNQVEQFGNHIFKEGSVVIPGQLNYNNQFYSVKVESEFSGIPVNFYLDQLIGKTIKSENSKIRAKIVHAIKENVSENENITLFVSYLGSGPNQESQFFDGESLIVEQTITSGTVVIRSGQAFANTVSVDSTSVGSAVILSEGVYFIRGTFVNVDDQILVIDPYNNTPSVQIGFTIAEDIVTSDDDQSLTDNAQGFSNFSAPGADRLRIKAILDKKPLNSTDNESFINLLEVRDGDIISTKNKPKYGEIQEEIARRTSEESGDYYVRPFTITTKESLNNDTGNGGIFRTGQLTYGGNTPSEDLGIYKISAGKAYIKGREVEIPRTVLLDFPKPRTVKTVKNQRVEYSTGPTFTLNRVYGSPTLDISSPFIVSLRDSRVGTDQTEGAGKEIGVARVYDFALESGSYNTTNLDLNQWDLSLFDIQTYTDIELNEPVTLSTPVKIKGQSSGAIGYLRYDVSNSGIITAYNTRGTFIVGEKFTFNEVTDVNRSSTSVVTHETNDVKSISQVVGSGVTFSGDIIPTPNLFVGSAGITTISSGISTVSVSLNSETIFTNIAKVGNLVAYTKPNETIPTYSKIETVAERSLTLSGITTVTGINEGALPAETINVSDFIILSSRFQTDFDNALYTPLTRPFISNVNLENSSLAIRKEYAITITSGETNTVSAGSDQTFAPFDEERYILIRSDGSFETLTEDKFVFTNNSKELTIFGLGSDDSSARLIATVYKSSVTNKVKNKNRIKSLVIDKSRLTQSGTGSTTIDDGLAYGTYPYGTRVQDEEICLLDPDITRVFGIIESSGSEDPALTSITFNSIASPTNRTNDLLVGEEFIGRDSGAIAIYVAKKNDLSIELTYLSDRRFQEGETVFFKESGITATVGSITLGDRNIIRDYRFDYGQKDSIYDYGKIVRNDDASIPTKKLRVIYESASYSNSDTGDITTINSYDQFDYCAIGFISEQLNNGDVIDLRPRVDTFTVSEASTRSPFEFFGRTFNNTINSASHILASDESIELDYSYYLPRIDRIFLTKEGTFQVNRGEPAELPTPPAGLDDGMEIASVSLPAYLCDASKVTIELRDHKRYQMKDIGKLEDRIKNLENITTLNLLEQSTENLEVKDANGLNRFKSGFFVDDFTTRTNQDKTGIVKNSIDSELGQLRPAPYTTEVDLLMGSKSLIGIGVTADPTVDTRFASDLVGNNVRRTGQLITLNYTDVLKVQQPFATRVENVTPFLVTRYNGTIELFPSSDTWTDQVRTDAKRVEIDNYTETEQELVAAGWDPQSGYSPVTWGAWETTWTGQTTTYQNYRRYRWGWWGYWPYWRKRWWRYRYWGYPYYWGYWGHHYWWNWGYPYYYWGWPWYYRYQQTTIATTTKTGYKQREGTRYKLEEKINTYSQGDSIIATDFITYMRSRNVEFTGRRFKPFTQVYAFFDGEDVNSYIIPKLLEVSMVSGVFEVGETIIGIDSPTSSTLENEVSQEITTSIQFRLATANHRYGPYNNPDDIFVNNPYDSESTTSLPESYSSTTEILNVDTYSLAEQPQGDFFGKIVNGMILRGQSSGAEAKITNIRLVTDSVGTVIGSFFIPNPNVASNPTFETGTKSFRLTNSDSNSQIDGVATTSGETNYYAQGILQTLQETIVSVRSASISSETLTERENVSETTTTATTSIKDYWGRTIHTYKNGKFGYCYWDPLAQSFFVDETNGCFVTKVHLFFKTKDDQLPVIVQLRPMSNGVPTTEIYPFSEVTVEPADINISENGSVETVVTFPSPVYLKGDTEHALVLLSESTEYNVYISRLGEIDITTQDLPESQQVVVTQQALLGSLFKSQNGSTWDPSQYEDLKFILFKAEFSDLPGDFNFYNPSLNFGNKQVANLLQNPLNLNARKVKVSLSSTITDSDFALGNTVLQGNSKATGNYVGAAGSAFGNLTIINDGIGYPDGFYANVPLINQLSSGKDATVDLTITSGEIVSMGATISNGGSGYQVGDVLTVGQLGGSSLGRNIKLSVSEISGNNQIILDNVQGDFVIGTGNTVRYESSAVGVGTTTLNGGTGVHITSIEDFDEYSTGLHIKVNHKNHGMHSGTNKVNISNVYSDIKPSFLSDDYSNESTANITLTDMLSGEFETFENQSVSSSNPGYVLIGNEIISYEGVVGSELTGITRGIDQTKSFGYGSGTPVFKYELSGVSLRRVNKTHDLQDANDLDRPRGLDYYYLKLDMGLAGKGPIGLNGPNGQVDRSNEVVYPKLFIDQTKNAGGVNILATQNIQFEIVKPIMQQMNLTNTSMTGKIRTISATSIDGSEESFVDQGFEAISLDSNTTLSTPRMIASKINEDSLLGDLPGNKSFTFNLQLNSSDQNISPVIDLDRVGMIFNTNRVNEAIDNYVTDFRTSTIAADPSSFVYATNTIALEVPATSLKMFLNAHVDESADIRAFYAIKEDTTEEAIYYPFPGYNNLIKTGQVIDISNSDGTPDNQVSASESGDVEAEDATFRDYEFTIDNLPEFRYFSIKLVGTTTNQAKPPKMSELRVIAVA